MEKTLDETLSRHGIRLLEGESISSALDLKSGSTGQFTEGLILTNRRVIHISRKSSGTAIAATLEDISSIAVNHEPKQRWLIAVGAGLALGAIVVVLLDLPIFQEVPLLGALGPGTVLALIAAALLTWGLSTGGTQIEVPLGNRNINADLKSGALKDAEDFVADFFEAKAR